MLVGETRIYKFGSTIIYLTVLFSCDFLGRLMVGRTHRGPGPGCSISPLLRSVWLGVSVLALGGRFLVVMIIKLNINVISLIRIYELQSLATWAGVDVLRWPWR